MVQKETDLWQRLSCQWQFNIQLFSGCQGLIMIILIIILTIDDKAVQAPGFTGYC